MKKLPIGIQTLSELITKDYVYIDKTAQVYSLITTGKYYFLSRPRRFGKSLLVSTFAAIFSGNRELFAGLAINSLFYDWQKYPVIMISFSDIPYSTPELLEQGIKNYLNAIAKTYGVVLPVGLSYSEMLRALVMEVSQQGQVVLLIDEYDYPILQHVHQIVVAGHMREILKNFYAVIKGLDSHLKFVFLTGVSKFSKTSVFSGLNNLQDISLDHRCNTLLGYTQDEIIEYFQPYLEQAAQDQSYSMDKLLDEMKIWYNGYRFTYKNDVTKVYNPFSILLFLRAERFSNYWFETGTPTFLINLLKTNKYPMQDFDNVRASEGEIGAFEVEKIELKVLLFQTGYITIKDYNPQTRNYTLGYPNKECINSLAERVIDSMAHITIPQVNDIAFELLSAFESSDLELVKATLISLFAAIPYGVHIEQERYYQTMFYLVLKMVGADIVVEQQTNIGRIDAVVQTKDAVFVIEFKINSPAAKALLQIEEKKYFQPYESLGKKIVLIGVSFDTEQKNINDFLYKIHK